ncbi:MAG: hypothetical protein PHI12_12095 [Dehalococcoidales bacterium]|nr:hypothetical protein [Dehalococcoidales bacterium]
MKYVSTRSCDAEGDVVVPEGIVLKEFLKNPVFFWGHNYSLPPLGSDETVDVNPMGLLVKSVYGDTGPGTMAEVVWRLVQQGHQKQSSIGYVPLKISKKTDNGFSGELDIMQKSWPELGESRKNVKRILHKVLMLEHSDVGLGMNRDTTVLQVAKGYGATDLMFKQMGFDVKVALGSLSCDDLRNRLQTTLREKYPVSSGLQVGPSTPWVNEIFDTYFIYSDDKQVFWRQNYSVTDGEVLLVGDPQKVEKRIVYELKAVGVDGVTTDDAPEGDTEGGEVAMVCPECGATAKGKPGMLCPKCNKVMKAKKEEVNEQKELCAWFGGDPEMKSSYKLIHHNEADKVPVWEQVKDSMGLLLGARGGIAIPLADRKGVYDHLAKHYVEFGKEVPEFKDYTQGELREGFPELYKSEYIRPLYIATPTVRVVGMGVKKVMPRVVSVGELVEQALNKKLGRI